MTRENQEPEPVWWTTDPAAAHAAAKVGVVYSGTRERISPQVAEPSEFGSVVRAKGTDISKPCLWQPSPTHGLHYWMSELGAVEVWSELTNVEVLRVGIGQ